ncbi:carbohydrate ABC transporter permease [Limnochorda pilosa]|uniref:ABC transmembrane type-1 domain-containing protein n=1 Tax=Limnochorda pilosa TaxID=1555112 RepID=A0A0K2SI66_LIMPI|nr:sugar ABC transporter permease [Limnochorda pilosa]BAS26707.1 hypothetical protein LIP_0850 [Limnochorda pilosa]
MQPSAFDSAAAGRSRAVPDARGLRGGPVLRSLPWAGPDLALYALGLGWPLGWTAWLAFHRWDGLGSPEWSGWQNVEDLLRDPLFRLSLGRTGLWLLHAVSWPVAGGALLACLAYLLPARLRRWAALLNLLPALLPPVAMAVAWGRLYHPQAGALARVMAPVARWAGAPAAWAPPAWLADPNLALHALYLPVGLAALGLVTILFLATLERLEPALWEAALVDGAAPAQAVRHVLLPALRPVLPAAILSSGAWSLQSFGVVLETTGGGPAHATLLLSVYTLRMAFDAGWWGRAAAAGILQAVVAGGAVLLAAGRAARILGGEPVPLGGGGSMPRPAGAHSRASRWLAGLGAGAALTPFLLSLPALYWLAVVAFRSRRELLLGPPLTPDPAH